MPSESCLPTTPDSQGQTSSNNKVSFGWVEMGGVSRNIPRSMHGNSCLPLLILPRYNSSPLGQLLNETLNKLLRFSLLGAII